MADTCENCQFWQPNGGFLDSGYCRLSKWEFRRFSQSCEFFFPYDFRRVEFRRVFVVRKRFCPSDCLGCDNMSNVPRSVQLTLF